MDSTSEAIKILKQKLTTDQIKNKVPLNMSEMFSKEGKDKS